ncbi:MAG: GFA family protein [Pseudomonadota bacterium]
MVSGSCLCKSVQFTCSSTLHSARYCHCENCTKFAGTAPATWAINETAGMDVQAADDDITKFNSGHGLRVFCKSCGSPLWFESLDFPDVVAIPLGVLDDGAIPMPEMHIWTDSNPFWCVINDNLPQHKTNP